MKLKGNILYGQSGGPTSVINSSAFGLIEEALKYESKVYACRYGIEGLLNDDLIDLTSFSLDDLNELKSLPGAAFGSCRFKLPSFEENESYYLKALEVFKKYNIRYFFYNGGNDSMDTCYKLDKYFKTVSYDCNVIGIPKTIDNDLVLIDHTPGFGSAAKYVSDTVKEIVIDNLAYKKGKINIIEIMGRSAGWLTASSCLASLSGFGPDLIYIPESPFDIEEFIKDVERIYKEKKRVNIAVSEGIIDKDGNFIASNNKEKDIFGHEALGGVGDYLLALVKDRLNITGRSIELSIPQRAANHDLSLVDQQEAIECGRNALLLALENESGVMVSMERINNSIQYTTVSLEKVANGIKMIDKNMYNPITKKMTEEFYTYLCPIVGIEYKYKTSLINKIHKK